MMRNADTVKKRFTKRAEQWLAELGGFSKEQLQFKLNENSWSLAELYDHILRVGRSYQLLNFEKSLSDPNQKKPKNLFGYVVFDLNFLPRKRIKMENFPEPFVKLFTPKIRPKAELMADFTAFINEVDVAFEKLENGSSNRHYHDFFGGISSLEWLAVIEIHFRHHEPQKLRLYNATKKLSA